jgi:catechol 2,3-dioxygenase-like lactoylglutathione lyase family enzyme
MIIGMNHITLAVKDIDVAFSFYYNVLGLRPLCKWDKGAYFLIDDFWFCLNVDEKREPTPCYTHYAFSVTSENFEPISQKIIQSGATVFKENTSPGESMYFLDPDGHKLEIHVGNWESRIKAKKENPDSWQKVEWFI